MPSGSPTVDGLIGGLARPGLVELTGAPGCGAVRLALSIAAAETRARRWVAWVDRERTLHPPAALAIGVDLDRLLIVQPPAGSTEGGRHAGTWAVEQLLRSGCFRVVVVTPDPGVPAHRFAGTRWRQAAEKGDATALVVTRRPWRRLQADVRLAVDGGAEGSRITVARDRTPHAGHRGRAGAIGMLPRWGAHIDPWDLS